MYEEGQVVEVCSEASRKWTDGFSWGSKITLLSKTRTGFWNTQSQNGTMGLMSENEFRPVSNTGPVRTVTRQEIVPGTYDGVEVGPEVTGHPQREVMVRIAPDHGPMVCMDHAALTRAAAVLTALAGALRDDR